MMGALSLIANWVRIFVIVVAGYVTNMHSYLITVDHYWFGWGVFVVFFVGFLWLAGRFASRWDLREAARRGPGTRATPTAPHETPVQERRPSGSARVSLVAGVAALACVAILPTLVYATDPLRAAGAVRIVWAPAMEPWTGPQPSSDAGWQPQFAQASAQGQRQYVDPQGRSVQIYIVAYRAQRQGAKLLGYGNSLLGEQGGLRTTDEQVLRSVSGAWREQRLIDERGGESLLWSRYRVGARSFAYPRVSQLWYGIASLVSPAVSSLTALRAACQPDCAAARKRLAEVARTMQPALALQTSQEPARRAADDSAGRPIP
jgi:EpsI family protein